VHSHIVSKGPQSFAHYVDLFYKRKSFFNQPYESKMAFVDGTTPLAINKGDGVIIEIEAYITNPSAPITLQVFQPLGLDVSNVLIRMSLISMYTSCRNKKICCLT